MIILLLVVSPYLRKADEFLHLICQCELLLAQFIGLIALMSTQQQQQQAAELDTATDVALSFIFIGLLLIAFIFFVVRFVLIARMAIRNQQRRSRRNKIKKAMARSTSSSQSSQSSQAAGAASSSSQVGSGSAPMSPSRTKRPGLSLGGSIVMQQQQSMDGKSLSEGAQAHRAAGVVIGSGSGGGHNSATGDTASPSGREIEMMSMQGQASPGPTSPSQQGQHQVPPSRPSGLTATLSRGSSINRVQVPIHHHHQGHHDEEEEITANPLAASSPGMNDE
jgi:hypothetical protein